MHSLHDHRSLISACMGPTVSLKLSIVKHWLVPAGQIVTRGDEIWCQPNCLFHYVV